MRKNNIMNFAVWGLVWGIALQVQAGQQVSPEARASTSALESWWDGKWASGNWFGFRDTLEDHGLKLGVEWKANFLWNVDGGLQRRFGYDDEFKFRGTLDFAKLTGHSRG
jgi:carbohydrate-selective porin OprB